MIKSLFACFLLLTCIVIDLPAQNSLPPVYEVQDAKTTIDKMDIHTHWKCCLLKNITLWNINITLTSRIGAGFEL